MSKYLLLLITLFAPLQSTEARPRDVTEEEIALTSPFCVDTEAFFGAHQCQIGRTPKSHYWQSVLGDGFCHLHHYCWGEVHILRANRRTTPPVERKRQFAYAIQEYKYVINNSPKDFILLPEIYSRMGEAELRINNPMKANVAFARARALKPDYWPAYTGWIDFLIKAGKTTEAKTLAQRGLEYSPKATLLIEQYQRLGGKLSDIVPKEVSESKEDPSVQEDQKVQ